MSTDPTDSTPHGKRGVDQGLVSSGRFARSPSRSRLERSLPRGENTDDPSNGEGDEPDKNEIFQNDDMDADTPVGQFDVSDDGQVDGFSVSDVEPGQKVEVFYRVVNDE